MSETDFSIEPVNRTREEARRNYDRISRWYDLIEGSWEKKLRQGGLVRLAAAPGEKILEVGFGTGHSLAAIAASVGEGGKAFGIDLSPRMRQLARERLIDSGMDRRVELTTGDATELPYADAALDAVFMTFVLELFDTGEIPRVLAECYRVLRPGGRICVVSLSRAGRPRVVRRLYEWGHRRLPSLLDCRPIYVEHSLRAAGFTISESSLSTIWGLPVETVAGIKPETGEGEAG